MKHNIISGQQLGTQKGTYAKDALCLATKFLYDRLGKSTLHMAVFGDLAKTLDKSQSITKDYFPHPHFKIIEFHKEQYLAHYCL